MSDDIRAQLRELAITCNGMAMAFGRKYSAPCRFSKAPDTAARQADARLNSAERAGYKLAAKADELGEMLTTSFAEEIKLAMGDRLQSFVVFDLTYSTAHEASWARAERLSASWSTYAKGSDDIDAAKSLAVWLATDRIRDLSADIEAEFYAVQQMRTRKKRPPPGKRGRKPQTERNQRIYDQYHSATPKPTLEEHGKAYELSKSAICKILKDVGESLNAKKTKGS